MNTESFLKISSDQRTFQTRDGKPFFWLGDTAWACPARATWEEWVKYVDIRAAQGFNVIQINSLPQYDAAKPVWEQRRPFTLDKNNQWIYEERNPEYFRHLDRMIAYANSRGMVVAVVVLWYVHVPGARLDLETPTKRCTSRMTVDQGRDYARFLVSQLGCRNVVWLISGDDDFKGDGVNEYYDSIGKAVKEKDPYCRLITAHPAFMSGEYYHHADWLNFNMVQSSHGDKSQHNAYEFVAKEWQRDPKKPVINAEPCYEGGRGWDTGHIFDSRDVRKACWWSVLAGSIAGITYGASGVWQWARCLEDSSDPDHANERIWHNSVQRSGSGDVVHMKELLTSLSWWTLEPSQQLLLSEHEVRVSVAASKDGRLLLAYLPEGGEIKLDVSEIHRDATCYWWNPANGEKYEISPEKGKVITITAPSKEDWIYLVKSR